MSRVRPGRAPVLTVLICAALTASSGEPGRDDRLLVRIPATDQGSFQVFVSPSGRMAAVVRSAAGKSQVIVDGVAGPVFDGVSLLQFDPDRKTVTYLAQRGKRVLVMVGDQPGPEFDSIPYLRCLPGEPQRDRGQGIMEGLPLATMQPLGDGNRVAYWGVTAGTWRFVTGTQVGEAFTQSDHRQSDGGANIVISADGRSVAYEARRTDGTWCVVGGGLTSDPFRSAWLFGITADGRAVYKGNRDDNADVLFVGDRRIGGTYHHIRQAVFTADGASVVHTSQETPNGQPVVHLNGRTIARHLVDHQIIRSPDGQRFAYSMVDDGRHTLVIDGKPTGRSYQDCRELVFSPDSRRLAHLAKTADLRWVLVTDGIESDGFDSMRGPVFSPDSRSVAVVAHSHANPNQDQSLQLIDGKRSPMRRIVHDCVFSADGKHHAYVVDNTQVVVDGVARPAFASVRGPLLFTRSGKPVYLATRETGGAFVVVGDAVHDDHDLLLTPCRISADGSSVGYAAQKGDEVWWRVVRD